MKNNAMHYKMYKAGKNWMVAGLMTTAVLAGLTLGATNVAHADTTTAPATTQTTESTKTADQVKDEVNNVKNNNDVNKNFEKTADQDKAARQDKAVKDNQTAANNALNDAKDIQTKANNDVTAAQDAKNTADENLNKAQNATNDAVRNYADALKKDQKVNDLKQAAQESVNKKTDAYNQAQQDYFNDPSEWNDAARQKAEADKDAAEHTVQMINNYDKVVAAKAAQKAADDALTKAQEDYFNDPSEWNDAAQQQATAAKDAADKALKEAQKNFVNDNDDIANYVAAKDAAGNAAALKQAAQDDLQKKTDAYNQAEEDYTNDPSEWNDAARQKAEADKDAAEKVLQKMNDYDAYLAAAQADKDAGDALTKAQEDYFNDPSEWNDAAQQQAQAKKDATEAALNKAKAKVADILAAAPDMDALKAAQTKVAQDLDAANTNLANANDLVAAAQAAKDDADNIAKNAPYYNGKEDGGKDGDQNVVPPKDEGNKGDKSDATGDDNKGGDKSNPTSDESDEATFDTNKGAASTMTREAYRAQLAAKGNNEAVKNNNLPQTGSENTAAVAAMGAVAAMLGLGLAAKKREF